MELQSRKEELESRGVGVASILYDPPEIISAFAESRGIEFPVLSDPGSRVIQAYDLMNRETEEGSRVHGIPYPGTFIVDPSGRVTERFFEARYQERFTVSSILTRLSDPATGADRAATEIETDHLRAVAYASDAVVAPGNRFSLVLDVTPGSDMHVYAPGDHTYQVIRLEVNTPEWVQLHDPEYPVSTTYHFEPLDETVAVYEEPFRLVQDATIPMSREIAAMAAEPGAELTITGVLHYQACDAAICYVPAEVPVSWDFEWRGLVRD